MDKASTSRTNKSGDTGVCDHPPATPTGPGDSDSGTPGHQFEQPKEASDKQGGLGSQDDPDPREDSSPAAKRRKRNTKAKKNKKRKVDEVEVQKMKLLVSSLSEEQLNRYEMYGRSAFRREAVKRVIQRASGTTVSQKVVIAMSGLAKVFVGEVVEEALDVCQRWRETPPLQPKHLREAVRRLSSKGQIPVTKPKKVSFF
ncbi:Transcription initiation factor TFIID subunit 11 [Pteropus alecto]|uniref:Transcription initiation factor TFIID subunit 11 n=1 Tax=Pteropus alecto TaxID=9402 RepID=L5KZB3_PTEAL|nr:Transcription initiation factor TFIID subunit 11 [Pteropus alecto]